MDGNYLPSVASLIDPAVVFECGSDNVKLKNLFEKFEKLSKERMTLMNVNMNDSNNQQAKNTNSSSVSSPSLGVHSRYGRLIPKIDFVEFVKKVVRFSCDSNDRHDVLMRPLLQYIDATCGRAGAEWVAFDEFVMVLMKVMQT